MATKKRRVPAAVQEKLERRRKQTASFAERQGAALGKAAREQLKPLLETQAAKKSPLSFDISFDMSALHKAFQQQLMRSAPSWTALSSPWVVSYEQSRPSIDADKLEALKGAEPYKVAPRVPDMVEVITGWRGWALKGGMLSALGQDTIWRPKQALDAQCHKRSAFSLSTESAHLAPAWDCTCGVWAFKDLDRLVAAIGARYEGVRVIGTVSLWGRVIETENGYRAEKAYPSELWLLDDTLEELGRVYDVPVRKV